MIDPYKLRKDFPMFVNKVSMQKHPLCWLDSASTTFKPYSVLQAVESYYTLHTSNSHRGDYDLCYDMDMKVLQVREKVASFINADPTEIVFTSGTTNSINLVAFGYGAKFLNKDDEILITQAEHASNVLPWFKVSEMTGCKIGYIPLEKDGRLTAESLQKVINPRVKLICIAHITNVLGYVAPLKEIASIAHKNGALVVVDGAQSVPHIKTDVCDLDIDFLSFSGHKMLGPTGIGVLYGKFDLLAKTDPFMTGGGMNAKFDMCGDVNYLQPPLRFEAGTQNLEGIVGLGAAIDYLSNVGLENVNQHEMMLKKYCVEKLQETGAVTIYNADSPAGIVAFNVNGVFAQDAATYFNSEGIAVRSGQHCAKILIDFLGTVATVRASFYLYTTKEDIDRLVEAVKTCKEGYLNAYFN